MALATTLRHACWINAGMLSHDVMHMNLIVEWSEPFPWHTKHYRLMKHNMLAEQSGRHHMHHRIIRDTSYIRCQHTLLAHDVNRRGLPNSAY